MALLVRSQVLIVRRALTMLIKKDSQEEVARVHHSMVGNQGIRFVDMDYIVMFSKCAMVQKANSSIPRN